MRVFWNFFENILINIVTGSVQQRYKISKGRKKTSRYERFFHYRLFNLDSANRFAEELGYSLITC